ncbi:MAG: hypothetical protein KF752_11865 [Pirellulaceae bacterium]|nr:hypothetical protein [Pirellulaceae bacterium]
MTAVISQYQTAIQNMDKLQELGKAIALSGMFGCQDVHQGLVIAADCFVRGMPLLEYQSRNSMVMGRPSMRYDAMLADFDALPGCRHVVLKKEPDEASIAFYYPGGGGDICESVFCLTWEDARQETFPYTGKEEVILGQLARGEQPPLKAKYATPRSRGIMLFARCVSDAIRSIAPQVSAGRYTPEELEDVTVGTSEVAAKSPASPSPAANPSPANCTAAKVASSQPTQLVQPAESDRSDLAASQAKPEHTASVHTSGPISDAAVTTIKIKLRELALTGQNLAPKIKEILLKNGLRELKDLTIASGDALIRSLEQKEIESWAASQVGSYHDRFTQAKQAG